MNDQERLRRDRVIRDGKVNHSVQDLRTESEKQRRARAHLDALIITATNALNQAMGESLAIYGSSSPITQTLNHGCQIVDSVRGWNTRGI
jgi:hypothetical protein